MIRLTSLEVCNFIFHITEIIIFELYTELFDEFSFTELKDELEEILGFAVYSPEHLRGEILGSRIGNAYKNLSSEKRQTDGSFMLLLGYVRSPFREFESSLRIVFGLDEDDIQLILKQYNSIFIT